MTINERRSLPLWKKILAILISILAFGSQAFLIIFFFIILQSYENDFYKTIPGIIFIVSEIVGIGYVLYILRKPISLNYKLTWTFLILLSPIPFCILYTSSILSIRSWRLLPCCFREIAPFPRNWSNRAFCFKNSWWFFSS